MSAHLTADELAAHLARLVDDDPEFIRQAVQRKFPDWNPKRKTGPRPVALKRVTAREEITKSPALSPDQFAWDSDHDRLARRSVATACQALLAAIRREHPAIVDHLTRKQAAA
jgi:hypothetical protein